MRAILEEYTGDTGKLTVMLNSENNLKTKLNGAGIEGAQDDTIRFYLPHNKPTLPVGTYKIGSGHIKYGTETDDQWQLSFQEGPEVAVKADKNSNIELGKPELSVSAIDEKKRYFSDAKEQRVYSKGTNVYISRVIKGEAGETYGKFSQRQEDSGRYTDIQPEISIVDEEGKEVAATKIKYG